MLSFTHKCKLAAIVPVLSLVLTSCYTSVHGRYMVPESQKAGDVKVGFGAGGGGEFGQGGIGGAEGQMFVDVGTGSNTELRFRVAGQYIQSNSGNIQPGLALKISNSAGDGAFFMGADAAISIYGNHNGSDGCSYETGYSGTFQIGGIFSTPVSEGSKVRAIFTPMGRVGFAQPVWGEVSLGIGFDIPVSEKVSLRPEMVLGIQFPQAVMGIAGAGMGVVF